WAQETSLPLPLGLNVVKRDIGEELQKECHRVHKESIVYSLNHKDEGLEYAMEWGRGMKKEVGEQFVLMYVNDYTVELGEEGKAALEYMFNKAHEKGIITEQPRLDVLEG
ncbi:MAG: MqnA/MqnD/SBP family protein, partial [Thermodesulfobacteriota bacterium]